MSSGSPAGAVDDRLPGADLAHQPAFLGAWKGIQHRRVCLIPGDHPQRSPRSRFTLDEHGFCLAQHPTSIRDWDSQYGADSAYALEVAEVARALTGAECAARWSFGHSPTSRSVDRAQSASLRVGKPRTTPAMSLSSPRRAPLRSPSNRVPAAAGGGQSARGQRDQLRPYRHRESTVSA
jgi:hypothetical protein